MKDFVPGQFVIIDLRPMSFELRERKHETRNPQLGTCIDSRLGTRNQKLINYSKLP